MVDERLLAGPITLVHPADLRDGLVRLVDEADEVVGEEVDQAVGPLPRLAAVEDAGVVLDPVAEAELAKHLHVELGALAKAVRLERLALGLELLRPLLELVADLADRPLDRVAVGGVVGRRPHRGVLEVLEHFTRERVELLEALDLIAEHDRAVGGLRVGREHLQRLSPHPEGAATEGTVVTRVLDVDELVQHLVAVHHVAGLEQQHQLVVLLRRAETEDARDAGHDDRVPAPEEGRGGRVPKALDLLVDRGVLLDVEVLRGHVGLGLVVVVVGDEVLDRVLGEELAELVAELGGQRLVVCDHERRTLELLHRECHRRRLARAGHPEQRLKAVPGLDPGGEHVASLWLVRNRGVGAVDLEWRQASLTLAAAAEGAKCGARAT